MANLFIGTSGWMYEDWQGAFYPEDLDKDQMLNFYQQHFASVEVNNTFYQSPTKEQLTNWQAQVGNEFVFAIKGNRYLTHMKNLKNCRQPLKKLLSALMTLDNSLGPVLFQLPPQWSVNKSRLTDFLNYLPAEQRFVFEFRHPSWYKQAIFSLLKQHNIALCIHDHQDAASPFEITADFSYWRFHGPNGDYTGQYSRKAVSRQADKLSKLLGQEIDIYAYFNNDYQGMAIKNARQLKKRLEIR